MLENFGDPPSAGFYQLIFDAALFKWIARQALPATLQETVRKQSMARKC